MFIAALFTMDKMWSRSLLLASSAFSSTSCSAGARSPTNQLEERILGPMSFPQADFCAHRWEEVSSRCQHVSHPFPAFIRGRTWIRASTLAKGPEKVYGKRAREDNEFLPCGWQGIAPQSCSHPNSWSQWRFHYRAKSSLQVQLSFMALR